MERIFVAFESKLFIRKIFFWIWLETINSLEGFVNKLNVINPFEGFVIHKDVTFKRLFNLNNTPQILF